MYREKIINLETGEETWRDYTPAEIAEVEQAQAKVAERIAAAAEKDSARKALLDKLGITEDEAKLLLGGN